MIGKPPSTKSKTQPMPMASHGALRSCRKKAEKKATATQKKARSGLLKLIVLTLYCPRRT
ncbi:MAG TPA: hypothetical protein DEQ86_06415 [Candidatus Jacksonbacteria bacterium]|nr:MAG: hypothetical protein A2240_05495 [Candidatus Jacksonbacteria bacterium RIFOXYA2_FULL_43_12]HCE49786.1 hypothetical protein [Candidatus Jacksonbacteria bacterium]